MKKLIAAAALLICLAGCSEISEENDMPVTEETSGIEETTAVTEEEIVVTTEPEPLTAEDFFSLFEGADPKTGRIADDLDAASFNIAAGYTVMDLSEENIGEAILNDNLSNTLFRFHMRRCDGILTASSDYGDMYAFGFSNDDEDAEYAVVLGSTDSTTLSAAESYISTCARGDYLAYCSEKGGAYVLMPVAAGNSDCGIYGVIPNAVLMGYDMSETEPFTGIPDSFTLRTAGAEQREDGTFRLFFRTESRFDKDVYYIFTNVFLNGENITDKISEDAEFKLSEAGNIDFTDVEIKSGDNLYFMGSVYEADTDDLICEASLAVACGDIEMIAADRDDEADESGEAGE